MHEDGKGVEAMRIVKYGEAGELLMRTETTFEVAPNAIRFFYPKGLTY